MADMVTTLGGGMALIVVAFLALRRCMRLRPTWSAALAALPAVGGYLVWSMSRSVPGADVIAMHLVIYLVTSYLLGLFADHRDAATTAGDRRGRGLHWAPLVIFGFFGFVFFMSAVTVVIARNGLPGRLAELVLPAAGNGPVQLAFPGVTPRDFQKKEALYNQYLEQVARQQARGWQVRKGWLSVPVVNEPAVFQVALTDREGRALSGAAINGSFVRPSDSTKDQDFAMQEVGPGVYQVRLALPAPGAWELLLEIRRGEDLHEVRARTRVAERG